MKDDCVYYFKPLRDVIKHALYEIYKLSNEYELLEEDVKTISLDFKRCVKHYFLLHLNEDLKRRSYFYLYCKKDLEDLFVPDHLLDKKTKIRSFVKQTLKQLNGLIDFKMILVDDCDFDYVEEVMMGVDVDGELQEKINLQHFSRNRKRDIHGGILKFCKKNDLYLMQKDFKVFNIA